MAHWDEENFHTEVPGENIMCATCKFKLPTIQIGSRMVDRSGYGECHKYDTKPQDVLWNGTYCPMYRKE